MQASMLDPGSVECFEHREVISYFICADVDEQAVRSVFSSIRFHTLYLKGTLTRTAFQNLAGR
jgi:hypothetical protein